MQRKLSVNAIENGTVIDHIPAGQAIAIVQLLKLTQYPNRVTIGLNLRSGSRQLKDLIKVEGYHLSERETQYIALFAPQATINLIKDFTVVTKQLVQRPQTIQGLFACPNSKCITNIEAITTRFHQQQHGGGNRLCCDYCEKSFSCETLQGDQ